MKPRHPALPIILALLILVISQSDQSYLRRYNVPPPAPVAAEQAGVKESCSQPVGQAWVAKVNRLTWVAYSSPNTTGLTGFFQPAREDIRADLLTLKRAGFNGLVTYASAGVMGREFPALAESLGFKGLILGIWDPGNLDEIKHAGNAAGSTSIVMGFVIGIEGLYENRTPYTIPELCDAISGLRSLTGLPAATSEQFEDYQDHPELLLIGDWLFPIVHPYWHAARAAGEAVAWQENRYRELGEASDRFIFFKEVGLPTSGSFGLTENNHDLYYRGLAKTDVRFVYFEGFDQPSKSHTSVEPHWGLFRSDRRPKELIWNLMGLRQFFSVGQSDGWIHCERSGTGVCDRESSDPWSLLGFEADGGSYQTLLHFDTRSLPEDASLSSVKLKIRALGAEGGDPLKNGRTIRLEICRLPPGRSRLPARAGAGTSGCILIGSVRPERSDRWYRIEIDPSAFRYVNPGGDTWIRLSMEATSPAPPKREYLKLYSGDAAPEYRPALIVRYELP